MIFDLIIVSSLFLVIILIQFQIKQITKYKNGYILATSIPFDLIEDERIKEITEELKRENSILFKIFFASSSFNFYCGNRASKNAFICFCNYYLCYFD